MNPTSVNPILNISNFDESVAWFEKLGWTNNFRWGKPETTFGSVGAGDVEIFLCLNGQGGRGRGSNTSTFNTPEDQNADSGTWMSIWAKDVDSIYKTCLEQGIEVTHPPESMPWNVKEMHIRHPDGHVFRIGEYIDSN